jgi:DNA primase catalytic subunit
MNESEPLMRCRKAERCCQNLGAGAFQGQAWRLWNEFLEPEFGFKKKYAQFTFSGHRGFHIHLRDPSLLHLDSNARREIVNYIRGEGIDIQSTINADSGWGKRAIDGIDSTLGQLSQISSGKEGKTHTLNQLHEIIKFPPKHVSREIEEERIVIMHEVPREKIGEIIREIRKKIPMHIIFATSTPTSLEWKIKDLIEELKEEDLYFSKGGTK